MLGFRKDKEAFAMNTLLTLVIALGGIATGIGAIWAAMLARRQLDEQRRFLEEQTEIARRQTQVSERQAQATEQSLAQTERSLTNQVESLVEQNERAREENERARLSFEVDMMLKLQDRWDSPTFRERRRKALNYIKEHFFTDDGGLLDVEHIDLRKDAEGTREVLNFFEQLADLVRQGVVRDEMVWHRWGQYGRTYWALYRPALEEIRQEEKDPTVYEDFERLDALMAELDRQHGVGDEYLAKGELRRYIESQLEAFATAEGENPSAIATE
jgi:Domain of unknown function (DUF4760)